MTHGMEQRSPGKPGQQPENPETWQAKVFLAYASEDSDLALALEAAVNKYATRKRGGKISVTNWEVEAKPSMSILQSLVSTMREQNFGIFIYTPVDQATVRGSEQAKARDNVVFETGLFMGINGTDHTFVLRPENHEVAPIDLEGIIGIPYPYNDLKEITDHNDRTGKLGGVGAQIVDEIHRVMAKTPAHQERPDTGQPILSTGTAPPRSAWELISAGWTLRAGQRKLTPLDDVAVQAGTFVVHATYGVGRVAGYDPQDEEPRYIEVQFGSATGRFRMSELYVAPIDL
jgi:predicted nucleotide-binding protein